MLLREQLQDNKQEKYFVFLLLAYNACGQVDWALDSISEHLGLDSQHWSCVEVSDKLRIPHCLGPLSYLMHRSKVAIAAGCISVHLARGMQSLLNKQSHRCLDNNQVPLLLSLCLCTIMSCLYTCITSAVFPYIFPISSFLGLEP